MIVYNSTWALLFDGGHVSLGTHPDFDLEQALTFSAWVKPGVSTGQQTLLSKAYTSYEPQVQGGRWVFERGPEYAGDTPVDPDRWTHLAVTFDAAAESGNVRLYVNGVLDRTHDVRSPLARSGEPLVMGMRPSWEDEGLRFRGQIAEMALWNTAHSAWQVQQEMNSRPDPLAPDLVGWWAMDDGAGAQVSDRGPRGHHGTIQGTVSWVRLEEPISIPTPGQVALTDDFTVRTETVPEGSTQLTSAPRADLPPSGRNGEARKFLDRVNLHVEAQKQAQTLEGSAQIQEARARAAEHLDAAHHQAALLMNATRFDAVWFISGARIHQADAQGRITPFRAPVLAGPGQRQPSSSVQGVPVDAKKVWVKTGVIAGPEVQVTIEAVGTWTISPQDQNLGPAGTSRFVAPQGYALPAAAPGALVGRVGTSVFAVGTMATVPWGLAGEIELATNDDVAGSLGKGYTDNSGVVQATLISAPTSPVPATDLAVDPARSTVFWAQPFTPFTIYSVGLAGDGLRTVVANPGAPVATLALDTVGQRVLYVTETGRLRSVKYDGGGAKDLLDVSGVSTGHRWQLAVDPDNQRVCWTGPLGIWSATFDGTDAKMVISPHEAPAPVGVAVDGVGKRIYWVDADLHRLRRAALDGTGAEDLYEALHPVHGLALDEVSADYPELKQEVYWSAREERISPRTPGIAGYWPLDEGEGRSIRNRARPTVHANLGAWRRVDEPLPPPMGPPATAVQLRGGTDNVRLPAGSVDAMLDASFTVEMWIRPASLTADAEVSLMWFGESSPDRGLHLSLTGGKPYMGFSDNDMAGTTPLVPNRWVHLAFRYDVDAREMAIFVDGVLDRAEAGHPPLQGPAGMTASIGRCLVGEPRPYAGLITGLHVSARALGEAEIRSSLTDPKPADLLAQLTPDPGWADDDAPPVAVPPESVLVFSGGGGHVELGTARALGMTNGSFTVEAWVRPDALAGDVSLLGTEESGTGQGLHLFIRDGRPMLAFWYDDAITATTLTAGEWVHLAFRFDAATREQAIFINGVVDVRHTAGEVMSGEGMVYLGRRYGIANLRGAVSELRIWKTPRTDEQIARNLRGFREQFALRGPVDGSSAPEHLFEVPSEGAMVLVSAASAAHEQRLLATRKRQEAQAQAAADVAAAHADSDTKISSKQEELEKAHQESAASVDAKKAQHEQEREANRGKMTAAQDDANRRVESAKQDAAVKRARGAEQAQQTRDSANATAAKLKADAQANRDAAQAERDRNASHR